MDLLRCYVGSNSSEDEDVSSCISVALPDYFGLDEDTDGEETSANPVAGLDVRVYTDTFHLSSSQYGPFDEDPRTDADHRDRPTFSSRKRSVTPSEGAFDVKIPKVVSEGLPACPVDGTTPARVDWEAVFQEGHSYYSSSSDNKSEACWIPNRKSCDLRGHTGCVCSLEWEKCGHLLLSSSLDGSVRIWDVNHRKDFVVYRHAAGLKRARWFHEKTLVLSVGYDRKASLTDIVSGENKFNCEHLHYVTCLAINDDDKQTFLTGSKDCVSLWDVRVKEPVRRYVYSCGQVLDILLLPGNQEFVCSTDLVSRDSADRTLMAWDLRSGALLSNQIYSERYTCPCLRAGPDPTQFLAQSNGGYVAVFSTERPYKLDKCKRYEGHKVMGYSIGFDISRDNRYLVSGDAEGHLHYYGLQRQWTRKVECSTQATVAVVWHPFLASTLAVGTWDGEIQLWR